MKILIFGDCASWNLPKFDAARLCPDLADKIANADLVIYNLEGPIGATGAAIKYRSGRWRNAAFRALLRLTKNSQPQVYSDPSILDLFTLNPNSVVALANNHVKDLGKTGLTHTLQLLDEHHVRHIGAGMNLREANAALEIEDLVIYNVNWVASKKFGVRFSIYNATKNDYGSALFSLEELRKVSRSIPANKRSLLLLHAGKESKRQADELGLDLQTLSELDFDLKVIHHMHQHVESGFEHRSLFILGHFVFCRPERLQRDRTSAYLEVDIGDDVRAELHRFKVNEVYDYDGADTP